MDQGAGAFSWLHRRRRQPRERFPAPGAATDDAVQPTSPRKRMRAPRRPRLRSALTPAGLAQRPHLSFQGSKYTTTTVDYSSLPPKNARKRNSSPLFAPPSTPRPSPLPFRARARAEIRLTLPLGRRPHLVRTLLLDPSRRPFRDAERARGTSETRCRGQGVGSLAAERPLPLSRSPPPPRPALSRRGTGLLARQISRRCSHRPFAVQRARPSAQPRARYVRRRKVRTFVSPPAEPSLSSPPQPPLPLPAPPFPPKPDSPRAPSGAPRPPNLIKQPPIGAMRPRACGGPLARQG